MSNVVPRSDPLTTGEITMVDSLFALATTPSGFGIAKAANNTFSNVSLTGGTSPLAVVGGGTGNASFTAYGVVIGGATSTDALQQVSGLGTANQVLTSTGASSAPTWQTISAAGTGTVTSVSVTTAAGVSGSVATATTTPAITITLGALTGVTSINGLIITANTGAITTGTWSGTAIAVNKGGTGGTVASITLFNNITGFSAAGSTGTTSTNLVFSTSPVLTTPTLGVASATSLATSAASPLLLTNGQLITVALTAQTTGGATLTIPDFASVSDEFTFKTKSQTMSNKTFVAPVLGAATATSINSLTITTSTGTLTLTNLKTLTVSDSTTLATNAITLGGGEVITFSASNALSLLTTGTSVMTFPTATDTVVCLATTQTLTNKRITPRILSAASYTTDTGSSINGDTQDVFIVTAQTGAIKFNNPSGTPTDGQKLIITVASSTTAARAITWDTAYGATTVALPTTTAATTVTLSIGFIWSASKSLWQCVAVA